MKNVYFVISILLLVFTIGCAASYKEIKKSEIPLENYPKVTMMPMNVDSFWEKHPKLKKKEEWVSRVNKASKLIESKVSDYFSERGEAEGVKELKVSAELFVFLPGVRTVCCLINILGAGNGKIGYHVKLLEGETDDTISEYDAYGTISVGIFGRGMGGAYDECANAIIRYIEDNR